MSESQTSIMLWVPGIPIPQGSKRALPPAKPGQHPRMIDQGVKKLKPWRATIGAIAGAEMERLGLLPIMGPVVMELVLYFPRPGGHFGTGKNAGVVKYTAPLVPSGKPDGDKCLRAICDALTGVAYTDDSRVVDFHVLKRYAGKRGAGAVIRLSRWRPR